MKPILLIMGLASAWIACTSEPAAAASRYVAQAPERRFWRSSDLVSWTKGEPARFTGPQVSTVSNPVHFGGRWLVVYEQDDRIYRAELR